MKFLNTSNWLSVLTMIVSIASIFISGYVSSRNVIKKLGNDQKLKRYQTYYIPFIKAFYEIKPKYWNFYDLRSTVSKDNESLIFNISSLLYKNLEYMGKDLPPLVAKFNLIADDRYSTLSTALYSGFINAPSVEESIKGVEEVNELFDKIVVETLQEATQLAKELKLEPIAKPLLSSYLDQKSRRPRLIAKLKSEQKDYK